MLRTDQEYYLFYQPRSEFPDSIFRANTEFNALIYGKIALICHAFDK